MGHEYFLRISASGNSVPSKLSLLSPTPEKKELSKHEKDGKGEQTKGPGLEM